MTNKSDIKNISEFTLILDGHKKSGLTFFLSCGTGEFVIFAIWFFCWTPYACYQNIAISSNDEEKYFRSDNLVRPILEFIGHLNIILQPLIIIIGTGIHVPPGSESEQSDLVRYFLNFLGPGPVPNFSKILVLVRVGLGFPKILLS